MDRAGENGSLKIAAERLEQVCALLLAPTPDVLDRTAVLLEAAIREARAGGAGEASGDAHRLARFVRFARTLLEKAAAYHAGWAVLLGSATGGYQADGAAVPVAPAGRLLLEG